MATVYETAFDLHTCKVEGHRLWKQVTIAILRAAENIFDESPETQYHTERLTWANWVRLNGNAMLMADRMKLGILLVTAIRNAPDSTTDANVQAQVDSMVNSFLTVT